MKVSMKYWRSSIAVIMAVMALIMSTPAAFARNSNPGVFPIQSKPHGLTYGQWSARWWQFALQQTNLNICTPDRPGSRVTFLAGGSVLPSCTVPVGMAIMFPVFNVEWSVAEAQAQQMMTPGQSCLIPGPPDGTSDADLQACATAQANHALDADASLKAAVDGVKLQNLPNYRAVSPPFDFTAAVGNPFSVPAGPSRGVADGFWIILTPLSPGMHTVHFSASVPFFPFSTDTTYHLMVQPGR